jgi:hypothetical protein
MIHEDAEAMVQDFLTKALPIQRDSSARSPSSLIRLPWEISELIAMQLTTNDALSLRFCSSVFLPLLHSRCFWRPRFCGHAERSYYFEGIELQTLPDLISASKNLSKMEMEHTAGVLQRTRVWSLVAQFSDLARLKLPSPIHILPAPPDIEIEWFHVSGTICPDKLQLNLLLGCKTLFGCQATLRQEPAKVTVFICLPGKLNYVCGLLFQWRDGPTLMMGYCNSTTFTTIDIRSLAGFVVAVGLKRIHAIKLVDNDGKASPWAGRPG